MLARLPAQDRQAPANCHRIRPAPLTIEASKTPLVTAVMSLPNKAHHSVGEGCYDGIGADDLESYGGSIKLSAPLN
jgi:hypothetical protein